MNHLLAQVEVNPVALFDFAGIVVVVLTITGAAMAAYGGFSIAVGIGKYVIYEMSGEGFRTRRANRIQRNIDKMTPERDRIPF